MVTSLLSPLGEGRGAILYGVFSMNLTKEELVFLRLFMFDGWFYCDVRNKSYSDRQLFNSIQKKLSRELINA